MDQMGSHIQVSNSDDWDGKGKNNKSSSSWIFRILGEKMIEALPDKRVDDRIFQWSL